VPGALPEFVAPMLARIGSVFDSDEHLFEVKWDGIRSLAFCEGGSHRLRSRTRNDQTARYPELAFLARLPAGTLFDGELVVLADGIPSFRAVMTRERSSAGPALQTLAAESPVTYVVFDLLYAGGQPVMARPLSERRELLAELVAQAAEPRLVLSDGIVGAGRAFFAGIQERAIEGMVAKALKSAYLPGKRTDAWIKIKERRTALCLILGYVQEGPHVRSLLIATDFGDGLEAVGRVGSGLTARDSERIRSLGAGLERAEPLLPVDEEAVWLEPRLFCKVGYLERTVHGGLRAPVFLELVVDGEP
jgi:DNA ligase D-like protein (predicted ligase)